MKLYLVNWMYIVVDTKDWCKKSSFLDNVEITVAISHIENIIGKSTLQFKKPNGHGTDLEMVYSTLVRGTDYLLLK